MPARQFASYEDFQEAVTSTVAGCFSVLGGSFIVVNILIMHFKEEKQKRYMGRHRQMLLIFSILSIMLGLGYIVMPWEPVPAVGTPADGVCVTQSMFITFINIAMWSWSAALVFNLFFLIVAETRQQFFGLPESEKRRRDKIIMLVFHIVCWFLPLLNLGLSFINYNFDDNGTWCWVSKKQGVLRVVVFWAWVILNCLVNLIMFVTITVILLSCCKFQRFLFIKALSGRALVYGLVFLIAYIPKVIVRALQISHESFDKGPLAILHNLLTIGVGLWVAVGFIVVEDLWKEYNLSEKFACCCKWRAAKKAKEGMEPVSSGETTPASAKTGDNNV